jgi:hypothetical protein
MVQKILTALVAVNTIATVAVSLWAVFVLQFAGLMMWDTNVETFKFTLNDQQRESILWRQDNTLQGTIIPLLITNAMWIALVIASSYYARSAAASPTQAEWRSP